MDDLRRDSVDEDTPQESGQEIISQSGSETGDEEMTEQQRRQNPSDDSPQGQTLPKQSEHPVASAGTAVSSPEREVSVGVLKDRQLEQLLMEQLEVLAILKKDQAGFARELSAFQQDRDTFEAERLAFEQRKAKASFYISEGGEARAVAPLRPKPAGKSPRYSGEGEWSAFLVQFQAWLRLSQYDAEECKHMWCDLLGLALEGEAQLFYSGLATTDREDYNALLDKLGKRFSGEGTAEVFKAKLQAVRRREYGENLPKLRDSLWLMVRKGYPSLARDAQEQLALDALLRAVDPELRVQCAMKDCTTLDGAVAVMERYEAVTQPEAERRKRPVKAAVPEPVIDITVLEAHHKAMQTLCEKMTNFLDQRSNRRGGPSRPRAANGECFNCHEMGHFARECPKKAGPSRASGNDAPPAAQ